MFNFLKNVFRKKEKPQRSFLSRGAAPTGGRSTRSDYSSTEDSPAIASAFNPLDPSSILDTSSSDHSSRSDDSPGFSGFGGGDFGGAGSGGSWDSGSSDSGSSSDFSTND
ncbi:MAG: hypothetical protein H7Y13_11950 [Sphingobacteriaceae bacterium]|nr:hypothetical protein [Sphingobacteriaceae bacterium]